LRLGRCRPDADLWARAGMIDEELHRSGCGEGTPASLGWAVSSSQGESTCRIGAQRGGLALFLLPGSDCAPSWARARARPRVLL